VRVFAAGSVLALAALGLIALGGAGVVDARTAAAWAVVIGMLVAVGSVAWWLAGPRGLRRERYMVLTPASLAAVPVLIGLHRLGAGFVAVALSAAFGIGAAIALGLAVAQRRRR
jgi:hypothetical protein